MLEATAEIDWPKEARTMLGEKVAELQKLGAAQGNKGMLKIREAVCKLLGWITPEWEANQEARHQAKLNTLKAEAKAAQQQLRELQGR